MSSIQTVICSFKKLSIAAKYSLVALMSAFFTQLSFAESGWNPGAETVKRHTAGTDVIEFLGRQEKNVQAFYSFASIIAGVLAFILVVVGFYIIHQSEEDQQKKKKAGFIAIGCGMCLAAASYFLYTGANSLTGAK